MISNYIIVPLIILVVLFLFLFFMRNSKSSSSLTLFYVVTLILCIIAIILGFTLSNNYLYDMYISILESILNIGVTVVIVLFILIVWGGK